MTKRKKLAKKALQNPELFSRGELAFFQRWLDERNRLKELEKAQKTEISTQEFA
jgi:hypothetical protein